MNTCVFGVQQYGESERTCVLSVTKLQDHYGRASEQHQVVFSSPPVRSQVHITVRLTACQSLLVARGTRTHHCNSQS